MRWPDRTIDDRFWDKVLIGNGCWLWTGATTKSGHGTFSISGKVKTSAYRYAFITGGGPVPGPGMDVCHTCDVPMCVRPSHLFIGTHLENMRDAKSKGRKLGRPRTEAGRRWRP